MAFALGGNLLDFLVLAILRYGDMYGYVLTQHAKGVVNISDSTLYPVLRRLQKEGLLFTYDQPYQGRNPAVLLYNAGRPFAARRLYRGMVQL